MSEEAVTIPVSAPDKAPKSFVAHAKLIGGLTLLSRILGMARESVSAKFFGAGIVSSAFIVAFSIPNLFRKLFSEGALSAAFIPLYTKALKEEKDGAAGSSGSFASSSSEFAAASVNMLCVLLLGITILGELLIWAVCL